MGDELFVVDTNIFYALGVFYPSRFPKIWDNIDGLCRKSGFQSVREVRRELERNCPYDFIGTWVGAHKNIFRAPTEAEQRIVAEIFQEEKYRGLVRVQNILKGLPVADPFVVAAGKARNATVVTMENQRVTGARIPAVCRDLGVECIGLEEFFERQDVKY